MIALDSSAIICLIQLVEPARARLNELVIAHHDEIVISSTAIAECLVRPIVDNNRPLMAEFEAFFNAAGTTIVPVAAVIAERAASLGAQFRLKPLDSIHLATAIDAGAHAFATTDIKDFKACVGQLPLTIELVVRYPHQQSPQ